MNIRTILYSWFVLLAAGLTIPLAEAQTGKLSNGAANRKTFKFYWETRLEPPTPRMGSSFSTATTSTTDAPDTILRFVVDRSQRVYFGYEARVETLPGGKSFRVTFAEYSKTPDFVHDLYGTESLTWKMLSTPGWPASPAQTVSSADVIALPLLVNTTTGQKIVDYVSVQEIERVAPVQLADTLNLNAVVRLFAEINGVDPVVLSPQAIGKATLPLTADIRSGLLIIEQLRADVANAAAMTAAAKVSYDVEKKKFENGISTIRLVLQRLTNVNQAQAAEMEARSKLAKALVDVQNAIGAVLQK